MRKRNRAAAFTLTLAFSIFLTPLNGVQTFATDTKAAEEIVILHTNDSHARVDENMGFAAVKALREKYEKNGAEVLTVDAGDTLHGLPFATVDSGTSIVKVMNKVGYDVMAPGNHDFNYGTNQLLKLRENMYFELISANIIKNDTKENLIAPYTIIERGDLTIGFFGLSTPETAYKTNPKNVETVTFTDPIKSAKEMVNFLEEKKVDYIIAVSHLGTDESSKVTSSDVAKKVDGIDVIIDGHSHTEYEEGLKVNDTLIVSTGEYIENVGVVTIKDGKIKAELINENEFNEKDEEVTDEIASLKEKQDEILSEIVGKTTIDLDGERETNRTQSTNLGNLTADAMLAATKADAAITNGGGIRASIKVGDITRKDLVTVFPFGNYVVTKKVTGEQIVKALENGISAYPESLGAFPQIAGMTFTFDSTKPAGKRITSVKIQGSKINLKKEYTLAMNDFIAAGGDLYTMFEKAETENEYSSLEEIVMEYIKEHGVNDEISQKRAIEEKGKTESKKVYTVVKGDTLYKIAGLNLGNEKLWKEIYKLNSTVIKNPNLIYPGMIINLPQ